MINENEKDREEKCIVYLKENLTCKKLLPLALYMNHFFLVAQKNKSTIFNIILKFSWLHIHIILIFMVHVYIEVQHKFLKMINTIWDRIVIFSAKHHMMK